MRATGWPRDAVCWAALMILGLVELGTAGCGGGGAGVTPPTAASSSCGVAGERVGVECSALPDCGGPANVRRVQFCEHCFLVASAQVCEAGMCRDVDAARLTTSLKVGFAVPPTAVGAASYTLATLNPVAADGTRVTCEALLSPACRAVDRPDLNAISSRFRNFQFPADPTVAYADVIQAEPGEDRLVVLLVTTDAQGKGEVKARGCVEHLHVAVGETTEVSMGLVP